MPTYQYKYGLAGPRPMNDVEVELMALRCRRQESQGGLGPYKHFRNVAHMLYPKRIWHDWSDWRVKRFYEHDWCSWAGSAASGKTDDSMFIAFLWWLCDPTVSAVITTSTTRQMIRKRAWGALQRIWNEFPGELSCSMVDSQMTLQSAKGDYKNSISAIAVREGSLSKAVGDIQGHHCKRVLVIIDEAEETPEAIYDACANLQAGCMEFKMIEIANPQSKFTAFGRHIQPKDGWRTITADSEEWETKLGVCLHFDGEKSPNVIKPDPKLHFLMSQENLDIIIERHGGRNTLGYWKFGRGFIAPEGISDSLISENALIRSDCFGRHIFVTERTKIAGLDPAFSAGGDKCKLQFAEMGDLEDGKIGVNLGREVIIPIDPESSEPPRYQVLNRVRAECLQEGVLPYCLGLDDTSGGMGDIFVKEWSPKVKRLVFGSLPTDDQISRQDPRPACEVFVNRVTQLWQNVANMIDNRQLKGLREDSPYIQQFTSRKIEVIGRKKQIEPKDVYKERTHYESPDDADAVAVCLEVARSLGARAGGSAPLEMDKEWEQQCREANVNVENAEFSSFLETYEQGDP